MFRIKSKKLRHSVSLLAEFFEDVKIRVTEEGWKVRQADRATVAVIDLLIPKEDFEMYDFEVEEIDEEIKEGRIEEKLSEEDFEMWQEGDVPESVSEEVKEVEKELKKEQEKSFGVNVEKLIDFLKTFGNHTTLSIATGDKINIEGDERRFSLPQKAVSDDRTPETSQLEFETKLELDKSKIKSIVDEAKKVSDSVVFQTEGEKVVIEAGDENTNYERTFEELIEERGEAKSRFPLDYLKKFTSGLKKNKRNLSMELANDYPMRISNKNLEFVLAPRVEE